MIQSHYHTMMWDTFTLCKWLHTFHYSKAIQRELRNLFLTSNNSPHICCTFIHRIKRSNLLLVKGNYSNAKRKGNKQRVICKQISVWLLLFFTLWNPRTLSVPTYGYKRASVFQINVTTCFRCRKKRKARRFPAASRVVLMITWSSWSAKLQVSNFTLSLR